MIYSDVPAHPLVPTALLEPEPTPGILDALRLLRATAGLRFWTEPPPFRTDKELIGYIEKAQKPPAPPKRPTKKR